MGYNTRYSLEISPWNDDVLEELLSDDDARYALGRNGEGGEPCTWYKHQRELKEFSSRHPNHLFTLTGYGEEAGDIWQKYFKGGKVQVEKAQIRFDPFNESSLEA